MADLCAAERLADVLHEVAEDFATDFALPLGVEGLEELLQVRLRAFLRPLVR